MDAIVEKGKRLPKKILGSRSNDRNEVRTAPRISIKPLKESQRRDFIRSIGGYWRCYEGSDMIITKLQKYISPKSNESMLPPETSER